MTDIKFPPKQFFFESHSYSTHANYDFWRDRLVGKRTRAPVGR
jgi:hypothetical protein